jgi:hypothetical protein
MSDGIINFEYTNYMGHIFNLSQYPVHLNSYIYCCMYPARFSYSKIELPCLLGSPMIAPVPSFHFDCLHQ